MLLSQNNSHIFICGQTRSGKTYFTGKALSELKRPVLFINVQEEDLPAEFMIQHANKIEGKQLTQALHDGAKIDFRMPINRRISNFITEYILTLLIKEGFTEHNPVYIAIDECHILEDEALEAAIQVATRGLKRGCRCVFITQRPALASKTLYTQAAEQYIFYLAPSEKQYLMNKGLDYDSCMQHWQQMGQYSYIYYDGFKLEGRRAV